MENLAPKLLVGALVITSSVRLVHKVVVKDTAQKVDEVLKSDAQCENKKEGKPPLVCDPVPSVSDTIKFKDARKLNTPDEIRETCHDILTHQVECYAPPKTCGSK